MDAISATIRQSAEVFRVRLQSGESAEHLVRDGRGVWLHVAEGALAWGEPILAAGDAASTENPGLIYVTAIANTEALLFDLAWQRIAQNRNASSMQ